ncbi:MAG: hypothetical protein ACFCU4_03680 [Puniceicoccaceae bacterium]
MKVFSSNAIAGAIVLIAFLLSTIRFISVSAEIRQKSGRDSGSGVIVTIAHWQLEPGFREGLDLAIRKYQELPHVKAAGVRIRQIPVADKVYNQFMNVQLIAGTAPDLAQYGQTRLIRGTNTAKFYSAMDEFILEPNPYNTADFLSGFLPPEEIERYSKLPWKDTFVDGMESTYDPALDGYFSIRLCNLGRGRLFYNRSILTKVKEFLNSQVTQDTHPEWLQACWFSEDPVAPSGFLRDGPELRAWLQTDDIPQTMGQFMLYCEAVLAYAVEESISFLVPISGSNYPPSDVSQSYRPNFFASIRSELDLDAIPGTSPLEAFDGLYRDAVSLRDDAFKEYFKFAQTASTYFPVGYTGLDREQAMRRFVLGDAAILAAGAWDVGPIVFGVENRDNPDDVFELAISAPPMPAPDERWGDLIVPLTEMAQNMGGAGFALNRQSRNPEWAVDFLRFATSLRINEEVNQLTGWLPSVLEAEPNELLKEFRPIIEGYPNSWAFSPDDAKASIRASWSGLTALLIAREMEYETFIERFSQTLSDQRLGIMSFWFTEWQSQSDQSRSLDRSLSVQTFNILFDPDKDPRKKIKEQTLSFQSLTTDEGIAIRFHWHKAHQGKEFPGRN